MQPNSNSGQVISHVIAKSQGQSSSIGLTRVLPVVTTQTSLKQAIQVFMDIIIIIYIATNFFFCLMHFKIF